MFRPRFVLTAEGGERTALAIRCCLAMLTAWNVALMRGRGFPLLYGSGVRYRHESERTEDWIDAAELLARRIGDCEDLGCYRAAELQLAGERAQAVPIEVELVDGERRFHVVVQRADGFFEDPSRVLGMT